MNWRLSYRADPFAVPFADRHYNRQKIGAPQFVPPGRCVVLMTDNALWVTSWPRAEFVKHAWPGAWINSLFRREGGDGYASTLIRDAVAATLAVFGDPVALGMVSFVDPEHVRPVIRRGKKIYGYCYLKAGFEHVGFTKGGLWAWQLRPDRMPVRLPPLGMTMSIAV
jgi:hypothetical protein